MMFKASQYFDEKHSNYSTYSNEIRIELKAIDNKKPIQHPL